MGIVKSKPKHDDIPEDVHDMCFSDEDLQNRMTVKSGGEPSKAQESFASFYQNL